MELVEFLSSDNIKLGGVLYTPGIKQVTDRVVIYVHGGSSDVFKNISRINKLGECLCDAGVSFLAFNNRGSGYITRLKKLDDKGDDESIHLGATFELIRDAKFDFEGVSKFLRGRGFRELILLGHSTGANKICAYNFYNKNPSFEKFVLMNGGDDTGNTYEMMGAVKYKKAINQCEKMLEKGWNRKLVPKYLTNFIISYGSFYDLINPDGDYNIFPFFELLTGQQLGTKELLREFKSISRPTLVIYGSEDEYCQGDVESRVDLLKVAANDCDNSELFEFKVVEGADHSFRDREKDLCSAVLDFLDKSRSKKNK